MRELLPLLLLACTRTTQERPTDPVPPAQTAPTPAPKVATPPATETTAQEGWGAVFWVDGHAERMGGSGGFAVGRGVSGPTTKVASEQPTECPAGDHTVRVTAPEGAALLLPKGTSGTAPAKKAYPVSADLVRKAGKRLHEVLPAPDAYTPRLESVQRATGATEDGVHLGSVIVTRRKTAPPVVLASGTRACTTVIALLSTDATKTLAWVKAADMCNPAGLLVPTDLDGDGNVETAATAGDATLAVRLVDTPTSVSLTKLGAWTCPAAPPRRPIRKGP